MHRVALAPFAALLLVAGTALRAQSAASQIVGCITDQSGGSIDEASIEVRNLQSGFERQAFSDEHGNYTIPLLTSGAYRIAITKNGFRPFVRTGVRLSVNQTAKLDVSLTLGPVTEIVQVTDEEQLTQRATTELGTVVSAKAIADLPLNGRDFQQLMTLTPGVIGRSVNGQWGAGNLYHLDGVNNTTVLAPAAAVVPILDTIEEFKVQSHNDKAEYGGVLGGIVNIVSRSGTNDLHGSAWEFVRNNVFDARNPFTDSRRPRPPEFRQNQFGAAAGGPLIRNRTFFYAGFEGYRYRRTDGIFVRVPSAAELSGDFSALNRTIYDPTTVRSASVREPFPENRVPASRISTMISAAIDLMFDKPNLNGDGFYNRLDERPSEQDRDAYSIKVDHHATRLDTVWLRFSQSGERRLSRQSATVSAPWNNKRTNMALSWTRTLSPRAVSDIRVSHAAHPLRTRNVLGSAELERYGDTAALVRAGFASDKLQRFALPNLVLSAPWSSPSVAGDLVQATSQPYSLSANLSWVRRTQMQFGAQMIRTRFANVGRGHHITFLDAQTGQPGQPGLTGASLASALLGLPSSISYTSGDYKEDFPTWSVYVQGQASLRRSLTINWGLRYDQFPRPNFSRGMINTWDVRSGEWLIGSSKWPPPCDAAGRAPCIPGSGSLAAIPFGDKIRLADAGPAIRQPIYDNFGPRVGLAWNARKVVLRVGYGVFFDTFSATAQDMQNPTESWPDAGGFSRYYNAPGEPLVYAESIERQNVPLLPSASPWSSPGWFWDPSKRNAYAHQWNAELQKQFSPQMMASLAYVGSLSSRLDMILAANTALQPGEGSPDQVVARKPFPYMVTTQYGTSFGRANYNAMQAKVHRTFDRGFQYLVSYTWSKSIDNAASGWYGRGPQNSYSPESSRGPSDYDRTHVLVVSGIYEVPFAKASRWLGGWQLNTITTLESGAPFDLVVPGDVANVGNAVRNYGRPNLVGNPYPPVRTTTRWFDPAAFSVPSLSYGNFGRNVLRAAPAYICDLSVFKLVRLNESARGEIRVEAFNALNRINPGHPDTNVSSGNLGRITTLFSRPRELQLGFRIVF